MTSEASPPPSPPLTGGALTRSRILDAAARLMNTVGLTRTTTKEIAREAGCSEASLYKHFRDKEEIFVTVLRERAPRFTDALAELPGRVGEGEVVGHLEEVARVAVHFYRRAFPMAASLFASPDLLAAHRGKLDLDASGPQEPVHALAAYLTAEQELGRLSPAVDPDAAAMLLIGACFHRAFLTLFFDPDPTAGALRPEGEAEFARETVRALVEGIASSPRTGATATAGGTGVAGADGGAGTDAGTGTGGGAGTDAGTGTGGGAGTDAGTGTGGGVGTDAGTGTGGGTGTEAGTGTGGGAGTGGGVGPAGGGT